MKLYVVSGLGADFTVLEKLNFDQNLEVVFLDWLIPESQEEFLHYVKRMADRIDDSQEFCLLGYSFGGIIVQEIHRVKPAKKVVILGSIRSDEEKSHLIKFGGYTKIPRWMPERFFNDNSTIVYTFLRKLFDPKNPRINNYFRVRNPYYLKWSIEKISEWKFKKIPDIIQIMADKDIVFPIKNSKPDYIIKNATHLFPATKPKEVSAILHEVFKI
ncbi:alpha/beta hydrolase [Chryseobacterium sp. POL2]|uniref:alpha/beta hydrolase n=1 Tax=Chryseobacterium sp. POL2 TaxID=2713414 RepID=UPI0013E1D147|nr:alpha/beta hydrolase [Chryseobacterium sp. POL2]QIG88246.1 alpha/beta hydrolase [Chryseobacterium sp. POL2]